jgi:acetolactate synthase-1/2/3 large subunit
VKVSDFVVDYIKRELGVDTVFLIVGGANMHLVDSIARRSDMTYVCTQHEQAAAMAADGYARARSDIGVTFVTSGPGGTNALTGVCSGWMDSTPCLVLSGQVGLRDYTDGRTIRQLGVQQINIVDIVRSVTKYAEIVTEPETIRHHLDRAIHHARTGRPGPVWLDVPQNVQMAQVEPERLPGWSAERVRAEIPRLDEVVRLLSRATRPILIAGHGVRLAGAQSLLDDLITRLGFPVITTWNGMDLVPDDHPLYVGRSGVFGQYGANFAVANADLILSIGSRLDTRQTGTRRNTFARSAKKIVVDIERHELEKGLIEIDVPIAADARAFLEALLPRLASFKSADVKPWVQRCRQWRRAYPVVRPEYYMQPDGVNSYVFVEALGEELAAHDVVVTDMGTSLTCTHQTFRVRRGQRVFTNMGFAPMGYGLPAAIGAWFGRRKDRVICLHGDGGLQMNIQELQTLAYYRIPVKLFILNNREYVTIKHTQNAYFGGHIVAADPKSGYGVPDFVRIADAYGLETAVIADQNDLRAQIRAVLRRPGPVVCDVRMPSDQPLVPVLLQHRRPDGAVVTDPLERLSPYLPADEFRRNMIVPPLED